MRRALIIACLLFLATGSGLRAQEPDPGVELGKKAFAAFDHDGVAAASELLGAEPNPLIAGVGWLKTTTAIYWERKDLLALMQLTLAGVKSLEARAKQAGTSAELKRKLQGMVKALYYNLASFTWPGWDEPGIWVEPGMLETGRRAAEMNLKFAIELEKGPGPLSHAHWVVGAQLLAEKDYAGAEKSFDAAAAEARKAEDPLGTLMSDAYAHLAALLGGDEGRRDGLRATLSELDAEGSDDAKFYADQVRTAYRIFSPIGPDTGVYKLRRSELGRVTLKLHLSRTAQLFHVVDQASARGRDCDPAFAQAYATEPELKARLLEYAELRVRKPDLHLYEDEVVNDVLVNLVARDVLTVEEVHLVGTTLDLLAERVDREANERRPLLGRFVELYDREKVREAVEVLAAFTSVESLEAPVFIVFGPKGSERVRMAHGRVVLTVTENSRGHGLLVAAASHAFLADCIPQTEVAAKGVDGLSGERLRDSLAIALARHCITDGWDLDDEFAAALLPELEQALESGKDVVAFLPTAVEVWKGLR